MVLVPGQWILCTSLLVYHQTSPRNIWGDLVVEFFIRRPDLLSYRLHVSGLPSHRYCRGFLLTSHPSVASLVDTGSSVCITTSRISRLVRSDFPSILLGSFKVTVTPSQWRTWCLNSSNRANCTKRPTPMIMLTFSTKKCDQKGNIFGFVRQTYFFLFWSR